MTILVETTVHAPMTEVWRAMLDNFAKHAHGKR